MTFPEWSNNLRGFYWHLRYARAWDQARVRRQYRLIFAEKKRLIEKKIDPEEIRLLCRHLANPHKIHAERAYLAHVAQLRLFP